MLSLLLIGVLIILVALYRVITFYLSCFISLFNLACLLAIVLRYYISIINF
jgi:hypothetical protein